METKPKSNGLSLMIVTCGTRNYGWTGRIIVLGSDTPFSTYRKEALALQQEFDDDCDPVRVYVCREGVPTYAAGMPPKLEDRGQGARRGGRQDAA